jgi:LuxR family maltose regulon positive regulatory protein
MATPLLQTKLYIPSTRPGMVSRPHLIARLREGLSRKLTLVSAPAGFGKTTLLSEWIQGLDSVAPSVSAAWLSLDEGDNELARFLTYIAAALQSAQSDMGRGVLAALQSPGAVDAELVLTTLLNQVAELSDPLVLVLDDYHLIESPPVDSATSFILDHLPSQMHLVIATRADPNLPLSRLRGRGQLNELRSADLRFAAHEAGTFITGAVGTEITQDQVAVLNARAEGWIAGLQMAAISLRNVDDIPGFISTFAGDHRYIVDYLVDEVLAGCPPVTRDFLLQVSILEQLSAPICDTLLDSSGSQAILEQLEQDNLFTIPLDQRREWYRFHHLFAELLRHRLTQTYPERIENLHARASRWWDRNGYVLQATRHALVMEDKRLAADLLERRTMILLYQGHVQAQSVLEWFEQIPEGLMRERPLLNICHAWALLFHSAFRNRAQVEEKLLHAEKSLESTDTDITLERTVSGHIASIQALLSQPPLQTDHDPNAVLALLHKAQELLPPSEIESHSSISIDLAYEYMHLEETQAAIKANEEALALAQMVDNHLVAMIAIRNRALIAYYQGELDQAVGICRDGISLFDQSHQGGQPFPGLEILNSALGYLFLERHDLEEAEIELARGIDLLPWYKEYEAICLSQIALTRLLLVTGDGQDRRQAIEQFGRQFEGRVALTETLRAQVALSRLERDPASWETLRIWMHENRPRFESESDFQGITPWAETRHLAHLTWIQAQIAFARLEPASVPKAELQYGLDYLERRLKAAQHRELVFRIIECSAIKALLLDVMGDAEAALDMLAQALSLAEPRGFRRVFIDKGPLMTRLLRQVSDTGPRTTFVDQLLAVLTEPVVTASQPPSQPLIEPLSSRELEVLELIAQGLSNREIGQRLHLALDTVKGHNRRIYGKLQVQRRTEAVARARELGLL